MQIADPAPERTIPTTTRSVSPVETAAEKTDTEAVLEDTGFLGAVWTGRVNLGASLQTGNTEQDALNGDTTIKGKWGDTHRATFKADFNIENENDETTEDNQSASLQYDYFFAPKWFLNTNLGAERDKIDEIDLRTIAGLGLGHQPYESEDLNLQYVLGPSYLREEFQNGDSDDSVAGRWALDYDQRILDNALQLFHEHELLVPVDDTEDYLFDSRTGVRIPIYKGVVGTAEVEFDRDNKPEPGIEKDDTKYSAKIGYEW